MLRLVCLCFALLIFESGVSTKLEVENTSTCACLPSAGRQGSTKYENATAKASGKAAYRNYYQGIYYYREGQSRRALSHFRQAYQAVPNQLSFALAYGLALGATGKPQAGIELLKDPDLKIDPSHADFAEMTHLRAYAICLLQTQAGQYWKALPGLQALISYEENSENYHPRRLAGMYNLGGYLQVVNQGAATRHMGQSSHWHVQKNDLEHALPYFRRALSIDSSRLDTKTNLKTLVDTLQLEEEPITLDSRTKRLYRPAHDAPVGLEHLPYGASSLDPFAQYEEVIFLVDISGSMVMEQVDCMSTDRFSIMRDAAAYLLDRLPENCLAGLATIGGDCETEPSWWMAVDSVDRSALRFEIQYLNPDGTTPLLNTLIKTPSLFTGRLGVKRGIFFISDGENVCRMPGVDICDWANKLNDQNIELNVLTFLDQGLQNSGAFAEYACLTDRSGGEIRYFNPSTCMIDHFRFDLLDRVQLELPPLKKVNCWGGAFEQMWAIFAE
ncbi:MAG: VWA domain-containing protein [Bacteroidota bacterium]